MTAHREPLSSETTAVIKEQDLDCYGANKKRASRGTKNNLSCTTYERMYNKEHLRLDVTSVDLSGSHTLAL